MLFVAEVKEAWRKKFPAITHVDHSSRVQTVSYYSNPTFWNLLNEFKKITGHGILINTSFNIRGEPVVCSPEDAYRCFMKCGLEYLVIGRYLFDKSEQTFRI
jgi:carbamoyltransferase